MRPSSLLNGRPEARHAFKEQWRRRRRVAPPLPHAALCPLCALCHLFWCSNLSQVNNILCCLKLCVGNKKEKKKKGREVGVGVGGAPLLLEVPAVCDFSLSFSCSLRLPDKVIIRCCFLPAITFSYNGSSTEKARKGVGREDKARWITDEEPYRSHEC